MAEYRPDPTGAWLAALRAETLLVLPGAHRADLADLWPGLGATDAAARVIDRVTAGGVTAAPGFALVMREGMAGSVRVVVRGPIEVRVGDDVVSGAGVATWSERAFDGMPAVRVSVAAASGGAADATASALPLVEGVVAASVVDWAGPEDAATLEPSAGESGAATAAAAPEPVAATAEPRAPEPQPVAAAAAPAPVAPAERPDERTMVPDEDTVVGFSRTERPRIGADAPRGAAPASSAPAVATHTTIVPPPGLTGEPLGDHDGLTVAAADIRQLREARGAAAQRHPAAGNGDGDRAVDRLALRMPDGSFEPIAGELLLGRAPAIGRVAGPRMPRPVVIGAGDPDISRTHLRVAVEGGTAVVTDLESRNGTHVVAPGQPPMRLRPSEPTPVLPETVIDLGGGWSVQVVMR